MVVFEAGSFFCVWALQRVAMRAGDWRAVAESQLAGNAFGRIVPGGMATAGALQYQMLTRAGIPSTAVASGLASSSVILFATLLALPILAVPAMLGGTPVDHSLEQAVWVGAIAFVLVVAAGFVFFRFDRPLELVAIAVEWVLARVRRKRPPTTGVAAKLRAERDEMARTFGNRWWEALLASVGRWAFDYLALIAALGAVGARINPALVLIAYVVACFLGMIPLTPGGLGFVEAGPDRDARAGGRAWRHRRRRDACLPVGFVLAAASVGADRLLALPAPLWVSRRRGHRRGRGCERPRRGRPRPRGGEMTLPGR